MHWMFAQNRGAGCSEQKRQMSSTEPEGEECQTLKTCVGGKKKTTDVFKRECVMKEYINCICF